MKSSPLALLLVIAAISPPLAWGQTGLYGSPELLPLPPVDTATAQPVGSPVPLLGPLPSTGLASWPGATSVRRLPTPASSELAGMKPTSRSQPNRRKRARQDAAEEPSVQEELPPLEPTATPLMPTPMGEPLPAGEPAGSDLIDRMLRDAGCYEPNPWAEPPAAIEGSGADCSDCGAAGGVSQPCFSSPWFASVRGLVMTRDQGNRVWTTYQANDVANQLMNTQIGLDWEGGGEVRFGRRFHCDRWSVEATYWTLNPFTAFASQTHAAGVSTPLDFSDVVYANPAIATSPVDLFDGAQEHRIWRRDEIHNVEINLIRHSTNLGNGYPGAVGPLGVDWIVGARFFRFDEQLTFASLDNGGFTWAADLDRQGFLDDRVVNNLAGFQFGCNLDYPVSLNWRMFVHPKLGIYNNHIQHTFRAFRGDGERFAPNPNPTPPTSVVPGSYPVRSSKDVFSFLTQVDVGMNWQFRPNWNLSLGYRIMVASGIALADHQIPPFIVDIPELADIDHNGDLLLHGAFAGLEWNY